MARTGYGRRAGVLVLLLALWATPAPAAPRSGGEESPEPFRVQLEAMLDEYEDLMRTAPSHQELLVMLAAARSQLGRFPDEDFELLAPDLAGPVARMRQAIGALGEGRRIGGAPLAGASVAYGGDIRGVTGPDGQLNLRLRTTGPQFITASVQVPSIEPGIDVTVYATTLHFVLE